MVCSMLFAIGFYALTQLGSRRLFDSNMDLRVFLHGKVWTALGCTPPGLAGQALQATRDGNFATAAVFLLVLVALAVGTVLVSARSVNLVFSGEGPAMRRRVRPAATPKAAVSRPPAAPSTSWLERRLPPVVSAMVAKDTRLLSREPFFRMAFLQSFYFLVVGIVIAKPWHLSAGGSGVSSGVVWFASIFATLAQGTVFYNLFGVEGHAAATLFLFPASRRDILIGKNLTFFAAFGALDALIGLLLGLVSGNPELCWRLALWMLLVVGMHLSVGNFVSLLFPYRVVMRGWKMQPASASKGITVGLIAMLFMAITAVLLLPVLAAFIVPTYFVDSYWLALTLPMAIAYEAGLYLLSLSLTQKLLLAGRWPWWSNCRRRIRTAEKARRREGESGLSRNAGRPVRSLRLLTPSLLRLFAFSTLRLFARKRLRPEAVEEHLHHARRGYSEEDAEEVQQGASGEQGEDDDEGVQADAPPTTRG